MGTVGELGELGLLDRLWPNLAPAGDGLIVGPGDDAAVWQPPAGKVVVVTTDSLAEGAHFTSPLDHPRAADLGWKLLAVSLSDLAAMGATPGPCFISLALPKHWPVAWVEALYEGLRECALEFGAAIAGGNITAAPAAVLTSTCIGTADPAWLLRRSGAEAGWELAVTGSLGAAAAALRCGEAGPDPSWRAAARPVPRLAAAQLLLAAGIRVALDISDGLFRDAGRLLSAASAGGLLLDSDAIPAAPGVRERWPREWLEVVGGGEDYELLFAGPPAAVRKALDALAATGLRAAVVGRFDDGPGLRVLFDGKEASPPESGHEHFTTA
ncbi:MAG: thiamine-phosphate kinase [Candidatus Dormibacteria bacterium]